MSPWEAGCGSNPPDTETLNMSKRQARVCRFSGSTIQRFSDFVADYLSHGARRSSAQISATGWRAPTSAVCLPFTSTSAASVRVL